MSWTEDAEAIWGPYWVSAMARSLGYRTRSVLRWKKSELSGSAQHPCPPHVIDALHNTALELRFGRSDRARTKAADDAPPRSLLRVRRVRWLTPGLLNPVEIVGLILYECPVGGYKGYVGIGFGQDEDADLQHILDFGGRIPRGLAAKIWPDIDNWYDGGER